MEELGARKLILKYGISVGPEDTRTVEQIAIAMRLADRAICNTPLPPIPTQSDTSGEYCE